MTTIANALIEKATLSTERGENILTGILELNFGNNIKGGFGPYVLTNFNKSKDDVSGIFITKIMKITNTFDWASVKGKPVRVQLSDDTLSATIEGIGHFLNDIWFFPKNELVLERKEDEQSQEDQSSTV